VKRIAHNLLNLFFTPLIEAHTTDPVIDDGQVRT